MRVFEDLKIGNAEKYTAEIFNSLPSRAKEVIVAAMNRLSYEDEKLFGMYWQVGISDYTQCDSPIEKILYVALDLVFFLRIKEFKDFRLDITPQMTIEDNHKTYRADFGINIYDFKDDEIVFVVECDGYEFHQKTKEQVKHDNEREMRLKLLGYDVLRFSGTQIYENPMKCANDIIDFAISKIKK